MSDGLPTLQIGQEYIPATEPEQIDEMLRILRAIQDQRDRRERPVKRNLHPKQHACLRAQLVIHSDLPPALRHGIFSTPRTFPALVRFSNAKMRDDRVPDAHGAAIKLFEIDGPKLLKHDEAARTQDFVFVDHPVFFARDVADILPLMQLYEKLMLDGVLQKSITALRGIFSFDHRFRIMRAMVLKMPGHLLSTSFWSTTPIKLGTSAAKLALRPETEIHSPHYIFSGNRLRSSLSAHLRKHPAQFALLAQLQTDPQIMPIEDATVRWDEKRSPFIQIATLHFPKQVFDGPSQMALGESLSFTPWHGLAEHRPLGGINRARAKIYHAMAEQRRKLNGAALREPTLAEVDALLNEHASPFDVGA